MKRGKEIGLDIIKCKNRYGDNCVKDLHYKINGLLFNYRGKYITSEAASYLILTLTDLGKELNEAAVADKCKAKKEEILKNLRPMIISLKQYYKSDDNDNNPTQIEMVLKYQLSTYLKIKENISDEDIDRLLNENKQIYELFMSPYGISNKAFEKMQDELITMKCVKWALSALPKNGNPRVEMGI